MCQEATNRTYGVGASSLMAAIDSHFVQSNLHDEPIFYIELMLVYHISVCS